MISMQYFIGIILYQTQACRIFSFSLASGTEEFVSSRVETLEMFDRMSLKATHGRGGGGGDT
jgi:hypothetical protein